MWIAVVTPADSSADQPRSWEFIGGRGERLNFAMEK
jgi:hypothetical protein